MSLFDGLDTPKWMQPQEPQGIDMAMVADTLHQNRAQLFHSFNQAHEEQVQKPMLDLKMQEVQTDLDIKQATLLRDKNMLDVTAANHAGQAKLAQVLADGATAGDWTSPKFEANFWNVGTKYPDLMATPIFKDTAAKFQAARVAEDKLTVAQDRIASLEQQKESDRVIRQQNADTRTQAEIDRAAIGQQNADANTTRATTANLLAQWKTDQSVDNEPQTMAMPNGSILAWRPKGNTLHEIKGASVKEMSAATALQVAKELPDKDPNKASLMKMLTTKALANPAPAAPAAPAGKTAMGGYKIGTTYGNLKYLGGDPKNPASFEKVQ